MTSSSQWRRQEYKRRKNDKEFHLERGLMKTRVQEMRKKEMERKRSHRIGEKETKWKRQMRLNHNTSWLPFFVVCSRQSSDWRDVMLPRRPLYSLRSNWINYWCCFCEIFCQEEEGRKRRKIWAKVRSSDLFRVVQECCTAKYPARVWSHSHVSG